MVVATSQGYRCVVVERGPRVNEPGGATYAKQARYRDEVKAALTTVEIRIHTKPKIIRPDI